MLREAMDEMEDGEGMKYESVCTRVSRRAILPGTLVRRRINVRRMTYTPPARPDNEALVRAYRAVSVPH